MLLACNIGLRVLKYLCVRQKAFGVVSLRASTKNKVHICGGNVQG